MIFFFFFLPPESSSAICRPALNGRKSMPLQLESSGSSTYKRWEDKTCSAELEKTHSIQDRDPGIIKDFWRSFPLSHSFLAQTKIKLQDSSRRRESTGAWPRTANSNLGQAVPVCPTEGDCTGLYWAFLLIWKAIQLYSLQAGKWPACVWNWCS